MRTSFYIAALLGFVAMETQAARLESVDFDLADYDEELAETNEFDLAEIDLESDADAEYDEDDAQVDSEADSDVDAESEDAQIDSDSEGEADVDADACEEVVNGIRIKLDKPGCPEEEKKVPFEQAMLGALGELSTKSNELAKAL